MSVVGCQLHERVPRRSPERTAHALAAKRSRSRRGGFTLIELLVVILIILLVSAVALPVVLPAMAHREVSEAARILQAALVGARDSALQTQAPSGIRLIAGPGLPARLHGERSDRPDAAAGGEPDHPDRSGAGVYRREAGACP